MSGWQYRAAGDVSRETIVLPRLGAHLNAWGSGHSCQFGVPHDRCVCECGVPAPDVSRETNAE